MDGVACMACGSRLKVIITGGTFLVREGSSLDDLNFEHEEDSKLITLSESTQEVQPEFNVDTALTVDVQCSHDPDHPVFGSASSKIKTAIYHRLRIASIHFLQKYA